MSTPNPTSNLERENAYLKQRNAQLQDDVTTLSAEVTRQRQLLERLHAGAASIKPPRG
jgi:cell division protein FtsB